MCDFPNQGQRLKWVQKHVGLSQRDMAEKLDMSRSHFCKILAGEHHISAALANALHGHWPYLNLHWLFTGAGEPFVTPESRKALPPQKVLWCSGLGQVLESEEKVAGDPQNHYRWVPGHLLDKKNEYRLAEPADDALEPRVPEDSTVLLRKGDITAEEAHRHYGLVHAYEDAKTSCWALRHCLLSSHERDENGKREEKLYILPVQNPAKYRPFSVRRDRADDIVKAVAVSAWLNYGTTLARCEQPSEED